MAVSYVKIPDPWAIAIIIRIVNVSTYTVLVFSSTARVRTG